jgi:hypothetical protein
LRPSSTQPCAFGTQELDLAVACIFVASKADEVRGRVEAFGMDWRRLQASIAAPGAQRSSSGRAACAALRAALHRAWRPSNLPTQPALITLPQVTVSTNHLVNTIHLLSASRRSQAPARHGEEEQVDGQVQEQRPPHSPAAQPPAAPPGAEAAPSRPAEQEQQLLDQPQRGHDDAGAHHKDDQAPALVADDYYAAKQRLIHAEQVLLRVRSGASPCPASLPRTQPAAPGRAQRRACLSCGALLLWPRPAREQALCGAC